MHDAEAVQVIISGTSGRRSMTGSTSLSKEPLGRQMMLGKVVGKVCRFSTGVGFAVTIAARERVVIAMNNFIVRTIEVVAVACKHGMC